VELKNDVLGCKIGNGVQFENIKQTWCVENLVKVVSAESLDKEVLTVAFNQGHNDGDQEGKDECKNDPSLRWKVRLFPPFEYLFFHRKN
jgi:hypothetical protein